ncbi:MAG: nicotinamide riboside transporter PnuC [Porticoccaceae bacterium]
MALGEGMVAALTQLSPWEAVAVILAVAYLLLAMRESAWCWYCAFASTAIYTALLWHASLLMQSLLNGYYMAMAVYGWWQWRRGGTSHEGVAISRWPWRRHGLLGVAVALAAAVTGYMLDTTSDAAWPYVDSLITWGSVAVTWMVAKKILENWLYWIVINSVCIFMYFDRGLYLSSTLFAFYVVIAIFGYYSWRSSERQADVSFA